MDHVTTPLRRCSRCKVEFPATLEHFPGARSNTLGLGYRCRPCDRAHQNERRKNNPDVARAHDRAFRERNKEKRRAYARQYYQENKEYFFSHAKMTKAKYPERVKRYYHSEKSKLSRALYIKNNRSKLRAYKHRRRMRISASPTHFTSEDVAAQLAAQRCLCYWCQQPLTLSGEGVYHVDHIIPLARGGTNAASNICCACPACNRSKNARMPWEWSGRLF